MCLTRADGVLVIGDSLNEPLLQDVTVANGGVFYPQRAGTVLLTLIDYKTDMWQDEFGYMWSSNQYGPYIVDVIPVPQKEPDTISPWSGYNDRIHSEFTMYKALQVYKALQTMEEKYHDPIQDDAKIIVQKIYEYRADGQCYNGDRLIRESCNFEDAMALEIVKAEYIIANLK